MEQVFIPKELPKREQKTADNFASNNNNPFLVSPYSPVNLGAYATNTSLSEVSTLVSSLVGNLQQFINVQTATLAISTITSVPSDQNNILTISTAVIKLLTTQQLSFQSLNTITATAATSITLDAPTVTITRYTAG